MRNHKLNCIIAVIAIILLQTVSGTAQKLPGNLIPTDPAVKIGKLSNGLTYYIRKNATPEKRAVLYLALKVGSLMETEAQRGLAHFTEHMAFNGTKDFPKNELINYLQKAGVQFGADLNAYTSFNETVYQLPIPTDSANLFHNGFKILGNWAGGISFDDAEIDAERGIIEEEERARGKNAQSRMMEQIMPVTLNGTRHANRLPIGKMEVIRNFDHSEIKAFYKKWYRPDLMAVIAVGDFDPGEVEELIKKNFSGLQNPKTADSPVVYLMPENKKPVVKKITDPEQPYNVVSASIRFPGRISTTIEHSTIDIYRSAAITLINKRLAELQQRGQLPVLQAGINYTGYQGGIIKNLDALEISSATKEPQDLTKGLAIVMDELERAIKFGFTKGELEDIKQAFLIDNEKTYAERNKIPSQSFVNQYLNGFLVGTPMPSVEYSYNDIKSVMSAITINDLNGVVKKMRQDKNIIIIVQGPESSKNKFPSDGALIAAIRNRTNVLTHYSDVSVDKPLIQKMPGAGRVIKKEQLEKIGVTKWELSNGVQVYLKPTDFKNDEIIFRSYSPGGLSISSEKDLRANSYATQIPSNGLGSFDGIQMAKLLQGKTANASAYISDLYQGFGGSTTPKDLEMALQLVYAGATQPRIDTILFRKHIEDRKLMLNVSGVAPESVFNDTINSLLTAYHPRARKITVDELSQISAERSLEFYKERFANNSGQIFVFVGNFVPDSIQSLIETYIGGLPFTGRKENFVDVGMRPLPGRIERTVQMGMEDKASVNLFFHDQYDYSLENNVQLMALAEILRYKMVERLREQEAGVYTPQVSLTSSKLFEQNYRLTISFNCATGNVERLINAVLDEIEKLKNYGTTEEEINKFKAERLRSYPLSEKDNGWWLNYMISSLQLGDDINAVLGRKERLNLVTPESVKAAANKFLSGKNFIRAVLKPAK